MTGQPAATVRQHSNSYDIFILVLTVMSLAIMAMLLLPLAPAEIEALRFYDNLICFIFLVDFAMNIAGSHPRREYFVRRRGWIDLLGSIPSLGAFPALGAPASLPALPSRPHRAAAAGPEAEGAHRGHPPQPQPVRDVHHPAAGHARAA